MEKETEKNILKAAEKEFMSKGFAGARTTSIAEQAGVTHAMLHYYFRTKEKLFERIISEKIRILKELITSSIVKDEISLFELIRTFVSAHLEFLSKNPELPRFLLNEIITNPERSNIIKDKIRHYACPMLKYIQSKINEAVSKGECREIEARELILEMVSLNVFPYIASPIVNAAFNDWVDNPDFLTLRKEENYDTIIRKLKI